MDLYEQLGRMNKPVPKNQDGNCPYIKWMGEDHRCPGIGEYKCIISTYRYGEYDQNEDYNSCICESYKTCNRFIEKEDKT